MRGWTGLVASVLLAAGLGVAPAAVADNGQKRPRPTMGAGQAGTSGALTLDEALQSLSTHEELHQKLRQIARRSRVPIRVGPLIKNGRNGGLIDIDIPLDQSLPVNAFVCGPANPDPTVREAIICTVGADGPGNTDPSAIGYSTQGREILAARIGNPHGAKVLIFTQQHGNEVASTEAAVTVLKQLSRANRKSVLKILRRLHIVMVMRANPDGGEPGDDCFIGPAPIGAVVTETCGITRYNVDPTAGGGFRTDTEADFVGIVGRGYDLNRYHYADLSGAIRPPETQAMVATALALQPDTVLDLHGDVVKTLCDVDLANVAVDPTTGFPFGLCERGGTDDDLLGPSPQDDLIALSPFAGIEDKENGLLQQHKSRTLASHLARRIESAGLGRTARFSQVQAGGGVVNLATARAYARTLGALHGGWESRNMPPTVALGIATVEGGKPQVSINSDVGFDPAFLPTQIRINKVALREALRTLAAFEVRDPIDDAGYCEFGIATGIILSLPEEFFGPNLFATDPGMLALVPGVPVRLNDTCPSNP